MILFDIILSNYAILIRCIEYQIDSSPQVYINPIPWTRSRQSSYRRQAGRNGESHTIEIDPLHSHQSMLMQNGHQQVHESPTLSLSNDQTRVAEWPFFKSFQTAQKLSGRHWQPVQKSHKSDQPRDIRASQTLHELRASNVLKVNNPSNPISTTESGPTTINDSPSLSSEASEASPSTQPTTQTPSMTNASNDLMSSSEPDRTPETTSMPYSTTTTTTPSTSMLIGSNSTNPLFVPSVHSRIQNSLSNIIDLVKETDSNTTKELTWTQTSQAPKSLLSLNVLFKNFGVQNLSNLDQILLRSRMNQQDKNNESKSSNDETDSNEQSLRINGFHQYTKPLMHLGDHKIEGQSQLAECKIEYTMKHVNITLMKENQSDYACDYVIDRKQPSEASNDLHRRSQDREKQTISIRKVCRLELTSKYFANDTQDECFGTFLLVAGDRFCFLNSNKNQAIEDDFPPLKRTFDFPLDRDAFDIRIVHKRQESEADDTQNSPAEIFLEIKPVAGFCQANITKEPETLTTPKIDPKEDENSRIVDREVNISRFPSDSNESSNMRKIDSNEEVELMQAIRGVTEIPRDMIMALKPTESTLKRKFQEKSNIARSCGFQQREFSAISGNFMSPNYPSNYEPNLNCSYVLKPASKNHCQVLLQIRDFSLRQRETQAKSIENCDNQDHLEIRSENQVKLCNDQSLIGLKMRLDFGHSKRIELNFRSMDLGSTSSTKRGFFIKFQQLLCSTSSEIHSTDGLRSIIPRNLNVTRSKIQQTVSDETILTRQPNRSTLKPPLEEPKFSRSMNKTSINVMANRSGRQTTSTTLRPSTTTSSEIGSIMNQTNTNQLTPMASTISNSNARFSYITQQFESSEITKQPNRKTELLSNTRESLNRNSDCKHLSGETNFYISSPNYPNSYDNNQECIYHIRRNSSKICYIELTLIKFDLEPHADCKFDYLEVNNVRLCGGLQDDEAHKVTRIYQFNEPVKTIKFKSDNRETRAGFLARVEQLECGSTGAILRNQTQSPRSNQTPSKLEPQRVQNSIQPSNNSSSRIEYDSLLSGRSHTAQPDTSIISPSLNPRTGLELSQKSSSCNQLIPGSKEATIRSPLWPESYQNDESISVCQYIIHASHLYEPYSDNQMRKTCQLELHFVHMRLGPTDCLDLDGQELLCGFEGRNMIKHYQFERRSQFVITFFTNAAAKTGRSFNNRTDQDDLSPGPSIIKPFRFMIIVKQLDCIDGFLASSGDLTKRLLYSQSLLTKNSSKPSQDQTSKEESPIISYDLVGFYDPMKVTSRSKPAQAPRIIPIDEDQGPMTTKIDRTQMNYYLSNRSQCLDSSIVESDESSSTYILSSLNYPDKYKPNSHCVWSIVRRDERFCHLELEFMNLNLETTGAGETCDNDYIQLNFGDRFCSMDQLVRKYGTSRKITLPFDKAHEYRTSLVFHSDQSIAGNGFIIRHKQIECEDLRKLPSRITYKDPLMSKMRLDSSSKQVDLENARDSMKKKTSNDMSNQVNQVKFEEVVTRGEFFELKSHTELNETSKYSSNMFKIFRIKRFNDNVCKLRLMFYRFDLEPSPGCRRDFLDINNIDRLCGQLTRSEDTRRDYDWAPTSQRDFLISFVSDSEHEYSGFHLFGQQITSCGDQIKHESTASPDMSTEKPQKLVTNSVSWRERPKEIETDIGQGTNLSQKTRELDRSCNSIHYETKFDLISPNWPQRYEMGKQCHYVIHKNSDQICSVTFRIRSLILGPGNGNSSDCSTESNDYLKIGEHDILCGLITQSRSITLVFEKPFITIKFGSPIGNGFGFFIEAKQNPCDESASILISSVDSDQMRLTTDLEATNRDRMKDSNENHTRRCGQLVDNEQKLIESPNVALNKPQYRSNEDCLYAIRRVNKSICAVDLILDTFDLTEPDPVSGRCEEDFIEIDYTRLCGQYPTKHRVRFNYFEDEIDKIVRFKTDAANERSGFSIRVKQIYDCHESNLQVANQPSKVLQLTNEDNQTASQLENSPASILCQFVYHKRHQLLVSPNYHPQRHSYENNIDCLYRIVAMSYDICSLRLEILDLDLDLGISQQTDSNCASDYLLIDQRRYCSQMSSNNRSKHIDVTFPETLPREIHLKFHTDSHSNSGRGFKLSYEQIDCESQSGGQLTQSIGHTSDERARRTRIQHLGQLTYPHNYVSSFSRADTNDRHQLSAANKFNQPDNHLNEKALSKQFTTDASLTLRKEISVVEPI